MALEGFGTPQQFADSALLRESRTWVSVTPYLRPRHLKGGDVWEETQAMVLSECERRGLPEPEVHLDSKDPAEATGARFASAARGAAPSPSPASWRMNRPAHPQVKATVGGKAPSELGLDALLDFRMEVTLDGEKLSKALVASLPAQSEGLVLIRGRWVEVDRDRLSRTLETFEAIERRAKAEGLSFGEAMRLLAGAGAEGDGIAGPAAAEWSQMRPPCSGSRWPSRPGPGIPPR